MQNYTVTIESTLRTATINEKFSDSLSTSTLASQATPIATRILKTIADGALDAKSLQGTIRFGALSGRTLGGQTTYSTTYDSAGKAVATANAVEPEHRISFAIALSDWATAGVSTPVNLARILEDKIQEGWYEYALYRHGQ